MELPNCRVRAIEKALSEGKSAVTVFGFFDENTDLAKQADAAFRDADQGAQKMPC